MNLHPDLENDLLDYLAHQLDAGTLTIHEGKKPASPLVDLPTFLDPLAVLSFRSPAFSPAMNGKARATELSSIVLRSGTATWGRLANAGQTVADYVIKASTDPDADEADLLMERTDFHRGGPVVISSVTLKLKN
jgi:hypothetical protein